MQIKKESHDGARKNLELGRPKWKRNIWINKTAKKVKC